MVYAQDVNRKDLSGVLLELTKTYFQNLGSEENDQNPGTAIKKEVLEIEVYQCKDCQTIYDPSLGEVVHEILGGTDFNDLPDDYSCSLCDAPKIDFEKIVIEVVLCNKSLSFY